LISGHIPIIGIKVDAKSRRRKEACNLESAGTEKSSKSFLSFNTSNISANLNNVGVSFGSNENEIVVSTNAFRHIYFHCLKIAPKS
jgi:hypothetical protein